MKGSEGVNMTIPIDHCDFVFANGDKLGMRNPELASVRGPNDERLKSTRQPLPDLIQDHETKIGEMCGVSITAPTRICGWYVH
jgi:hypothetical protein